MSDGRELMVLTRICYVVLPNRPFGRYQGDNHTGSGAHISAFRLLCAG